MRDSKAATESQSEYHVASYVVLTRPEFAQSMARQITRLPGLEVHAREDGKLIVTAEAENTCQLAEVAGALELMDHVLQVAPVYHEFTREVDTQADRGQKEDTDTTENVRSHIR